MFARNRRRRAFTLVELLVVVVIIGMLIGLLMPAVNSARQSAKRTQCVNHQMELGKAILQYESAKQQFPGYVNVLQGASFVINGQPQPREVSWIVVILEYLGRNDLWEQWRSNPQAIGVPVQQLVCPVDSNASLTNPNAPLSYVVNPMLFRDRGTTDCTDSNGKVDLGKLMAKLNSSASKVSLANVKSPQQTILLSERLNPTLQEINQFAAQTNPNYVVLANNKIGPLVTGPWDNTNNLLNNDIKTKPFPFCVIWEDAKGKLPPNTVPPYPVGKFSLGVPNNPMDPGTWSWLKSGHPGGVVVTFCDGRVDFVAGQTPCTGEDPSSPTYSWTP